MLEAFLFAKGAVARAYEKEGLLATEHAVLHLLYARFWHKILFDLGHVSTAEPFYKLVNQGLIQGEDGQKMSKSRGNVVPPGAAKADAFKVSAVAEPLLKPVVDLPIPVSMVPAGTK